MTIIERIMAFVIGRGRDTAPATSLAPVDSSADSPVILHLPESESQFERADDAVAVMESPDDELADAWFVPRDVPVHHEPRAADREPVDRTLHDHVVAVLRQPDLELPRLPQAAQQALVLLQHDDFNARRLAALIEQDPMLAAGVLRLANSALYRGVNEITRLEPAFARVGQRTLRGLVLSENVKSLAIRVTGNGERSLGYELWQRSIASAAIAGHFAERAGMAEDEAFLLGLLHDIGMLALLRVVHDYQKAHAQRVPRALFDVLCEEWHEHVGLRLADAWNLPSPMRDLIASHHREPGAGDALAMQRHLLRLTDVIVSMLEYGPYVSYDFFALPCTQALGLHDTPATREMLLELPQMIERRISLC